MGSLPGTAAEVLDDAVRAELCPDKLSANEWLDVVSAAHRVGVHTTSTLMFGHVDCDGPEAWVGLALFTIFSPELGLWVGTFHVILQSKHRSTDDSQ